MHVVGFNVTKFDSPDALKAYAVIAGQTDSLLAILVWQYDCYEAGAGKMFWVKDRNGVEVPSDQRALLDLESYEPSRALGHAGKDRT